MNREQPTDRRKLKRQARKADEAWEAAGRPIIMEHQGSLYISRDGGVIWTLIDAQFIGEAS